MIGFLISLSIKGKVMDEESSKPMGYAVVMVYRDTQRVGGTYTDTLGNFEIEGIERGNYRIVASFIGYERKEIRIDLERDTFLTITLKPKPIPIKEQVVEAEAPKVVYKVDRKVVYPKGEVEKRGRASDILRGVAGVEVDAEGNVRVMGSDRYVLFVDGKPTNMRLKDISAGFVEYIEVITNPGAEWDAEGEAVINVVTKKQRELGYSLNSQVRGSNFLGYNLNILYATNYGNFTTYFRVDGGRERIVGSTIDSVRFPDGSSFVSRLNINAVLPSLNGTLGFRYGNLSLEMGGNFQNQILDASQNRYFGDSTILGKLYWRNRSGNFYITSDYAFKGLKLSFYYSRVPYESYRLDSSSSWKIVYQTQRPQEKLFGQVDYALDMGKTKVSLGTKGMLNMHALSYSLDKFGNPNFPDIEGGSFNIKRFVGASYVDLNSTFWKFEYKAGLRYERTDVIADTIRNSYQDLFPSLSLIYRFNLGNMQFGYRRGIWRPDERNLLPIYHFLNANSLSKGNPRLLPEISDNFVMSMNLQKGKFSINPEFYYKRISNIIEDTTYVLSPYPVAVSYNMNYREGSRVGFSTTLSYNVGLLKQLGPLPVGIFDINFGINGYNHRYASVSDTSYSLSLSVQGILFLVVIQGYVYISPASKYRFYEVDRQIFSYLAFIVPLGNLSMFIFLNDPFGLQKPISRTQVGGYYQYQQQQPTRMIMISLSYNFSKRFEGSVKPLGERDVEQTGEKLIPGKPSE